MFGVWLPETIAIAAFSILFSVFSVRRLPKKPWLSFLYSCLAAFAVAFTAIGSKQGFSGGAEAWFWNVFGALMFTPVWLVPTAAAHILLRRQNIRKR